MTAPDQTSAAGLELWRKAAAKEAQGDLSRLVWRPDTGVEIQALCTRADLHDLAHHGELPGCAPYVRGSEALQAPFALPLVVPEPRDLATIPAEVSLARSFLHLGAAFATPQALEALRAHCAQRGIAARELRATLASNPGAQADQAAAWARAAELLRYAAHHLPFVRTICIPSRDWQHRGAGPVSESACALVAGIDVLRRLEPLGIAPELAARHVAFRFAVRTEVPVEIARLRIVRGLWAKIVRAFGVVHQDALRMHLEAETSPVTCTRQDPHTNLVRSTLQAFAAAAAGCETLSVLPFDARTHRWHELSARLARNQQRILEYEACLGRTADPFGGSYAIETLSDRLGRAIWGRLQQIEREGGLAKLDLAPELAARQARLASGEETLIGTTRQRAPDPATLPPLPEGPWHASDAADRALEAGR